MADGLIKQRRCIARGAFGSAGDEGEGVIGYFGLLTVSDTAEHGDHVFGFDATQVKALATGKHGHRDFTDFRCREDKLHMCGRLFECLEERIEGRGGQHVHLIDDVNLVAGRGCTISDRVDDFTDIIDASAGGGVHFHDVDMAAFHDGGAVLADAARLGCGRACSIGANAVHAFGDDAGCCCFARSTDPCHDESLRDAICGKRVFERAYHRLLADEINKSLGAIFTRENLIACLWSIAHGMPCQIRSWAKVAAQGPKV